tara:strand:- start:40 stop:501 length:462 start_codon:yes stop_codon:yes gene_type:complete
MTYGSPYENIWVDYSPHTEGWGDVSVAESYGYTEYIRKDISDAPNSNIKALCDQLAKVSMERTKAHARVKELEAKNDRQWLIADNARNDLILVQIGNIACQKRIKQLEDALESISCMGFDMPATLELTDEAWSKRRAGLMQQIAREALKETKK